MNIKNGFEFSAGGVVKKESRVLLIKTPGKSETGVWTFPKGKIERGENSAKAALREVLEETGYRCSIEKQLGTTRYFFRRRGTIVNKKVNWFLMSPVKKEGYPEREVRKVRWVKVQQAKKKLKYNSDIVLLKKVYTGVK